MAQIKCPNCGTVRVVPEGKRKRCRKCGTALTTNPPKPAKVETITAEQLKERYPKQIKQIIAEAVGAEAVGEKVETKLPAETTVDLESLNYKELKSLAKEKGLDVPVVISKANLIKMIAEAEKPEPEPDSGNENNQ
ncbi:MAG: hypothetical protein DRP62_05270 [Planctomycetota bacterium]|nr:MAG: hypothetical protein DRP62_05270 [Planctomycetota bacterium]